MPADSCRRCTGYEQTSDCGKGIYNASCGCSASLAFNDHVLETAPLCPVANDGLFTCPLDGSATDTAVIPLKNGTLLPYPACQCLSWNAVQDSNVTADDSVAVTATCYGAGDIPWGCFLGVVIKGNVSLGAGFWVESPVTAITMMKNDVECGMEASHGIVGLAYPDISDLRADNALTRLAAGHPGRVTDAFGFCLVPPPSNRDPAKEPLTKVGSAGLFVMGRYADDYMLASELQWTALAEATYYTVFVQDVKFDSASLALPTFAYNIMGTIVDSGTQILMLPEGLYERLTGFQNQTGYWPDLTFTLAVTKCVQLVLVEVTLQFCGDGANYLGNERNILRSTDMSSVWENGPQAAGWIIGTTGQCDAENDPYTPKICCVFLFAVTTELDITNVPSSAWRVLPEDDCQASPSTATAPDETVSFTPSPSAPNGTTLQVTIPATMYARDTLYIENGDQLILGQPLFWSYYMAFDKVSNRIGFATQKSCMIKDDSAWLQFDELSAGHLAALVVGVVCGLLLMGVVYFRLFRYRLRSATPSGDYALMK